MTGVRILVLGTGDLGILVTATLWGHKAGNKKNRNRQANTFLMDLLFTPPGLTTFVMLFYALFTYDIDSVIANIHTMYYL